MSKSDYYLDVAINAAIEYVRKKDGIELVGEDTLRYKSIIINYEEFDIFAFFRYGLLIDYDSNTDELQIDEVEGVRCGKYTKEMLAFFKSSVDRFGSLEEFQKVYKEFKSHNADITNIPEVNKKFRKEFGIHDMIPFPGDLDNLIDQ